MGTATPEKGQKSMKNRKTPEPMRCRKCGKEIAIIQERIYRKIIVDAEAVRVIPMENGIQFVRIDGSKVMGKIAPEDAEGAEYAYRPHDRSCGG